MHVWFKSIILMGKIVLTAGWGYGNPVSTVSSDSSETETELSWLDKIYYNEWINRRQKVTIISMKLIDRLVPHNVNVILPVVISTVALDVLVHLSSPSIP